MAIDYDELEAGVEQLAIDRGWTPEMSLRVVVRTLADVYSDAEGAADIDDLIEAVEEAGEAVEQAADDDDDDGGGGDA